MEDVSISLNVHNMHGLGGGRESDCGKVAHVYSPANEKLESPDLTSWDNKIFCSR